VCAERIEDERSDLIGREVRSVDASVGARICFGALGHQFFYTIKG
jgi:hypothetical protein